MQKLRWPFVALTVVALGALLGACSPLSGVTASSEARTLAGGAGSSVVVNGQATEGLVVSATGTASADPEVAEVGFGVEIQGADPDALVSEAAASMDAAMAAASEFGILEDKTRTLNYSLWVENVHDPETGRPTGDIIYHLSHQVQVTTGNIDAVGELLAGVVNAGANAVSGVAFTVEDSTALVDQARDAALKDAQARAERIAETMGVSVGRPVLITETSGNYPIAVDRGIGGAGAVMESAAPRVDAGSFSVSVSVQIVYEIR
ncbi:MAG: SIMPL domain-containing protein [Anaerolineae bacterium]|nr:SIMPL domain-containing protein [Anaerolineae bacterium]